MGCSAQVKESEELAVTTEDLGHLWQLVEEKDGGPAWQQMMDKTMPRFTYRAWKREPEVCNSFQLLNGYKSFLGF